MDDLRHAQWQVGDASLHVVELGDPERPPVLLLHGWPQSWRCWLEVMRLGAPHARMIAIDLPGIGGSTGAAPAAKKQIADVVAGLIEAMGLGPVTVAGHDVGGVVAFFLLRRCPRLAHAVIVNTAIPGVEPWDEVVTNPFVWHIAFHGTPALPELLVRGRQREYFGYFYDLLSPDPGAITDAARDEYVRAYASDDALAAGFGWYRGFGRDARDVARHAEIRVDVPVLYLHGEHEFGDPQRYANGLRGAGLASVNLDLIPGAGHFAAEDAPAAVWNAIARFVPISGDFNST